MVPETIRRRRVFAAGLGRARRSWTTIIYTSTAVAELLGNKEIGAVNLIVGLNVGHWFLFQTNSTITACLSCAPPPPQLAYHNALYDTSGVGPIKGRLAWVKGIVKRSYAQSDEAIRIPFREESCQWMTAPSQ